ncbi:MAG: YbaK/EbsC family protein [Alphaproteobacteria bacterium]|nr:YbaK/EbsC family protein [Alphaproteobacteria bacterium]MBO6863597.1 YbaK/EbsC family protein [Alphaproteobacteria bacterium]
MKRATGKTAMRVQAVLGDGFEVLEFETSTATSDQAAAAIGCDVAQIAKSLVFQEKDSAAAVMVIASGVNRVDEKKLRDLIGEKVLRPDADFVRQATGYAIGGVSPVGHATEMRIFLDEDLKSYPEIWAAAGAPNAVFRLTPDDLERLTGGRYADLAKR